MFVSADPATHDDLRARRDATTEAVITALARPVRARRSRPPSSPTPSPQIDPLPEDGAPLTHVLDDLAPILEGGIRLGDPNCVAHLHPAPLIEAAAAELAVGVTNQSMDAFDASPAATFVEDALVTRLAELHGFPGGSGVMTMGGTASNLLGLLLARDRAGRERPARRAAAEPLADRGVGDLARQHPPLGGAARARDRRGDRGAHRRPRGRCRSPRCGSSRTTRT